MRFQSRLDIATHFRCHCLPSPQMGPSSCPKTSSGLPLILHYDESHHYFIIYHSVIIRETKCTIQVMCLKHPIPLPTQYVEKLSSMKLVPGIKKVGGHSIKGSWVHRQEQRQLLNQGCCNWRPGRSGQESLGISEAENLWRPNASLNAQSSQLEVISSTGQSFILYVQCVLQSLLPWSGF